MIMAKKSGVDSEIEASYTIDMNFCGGGTNENINTHLWQIYNRKKSNSTMNAEWMVVADGVWFARAFVRRPIKVCS